MPCPREARNVLIRLAADSVSDMAMNAILPSYERWIRASCPAAQRTSLYLQLGPVPGTVRERIFDDQQASEFLDRYRQSLGPLCRCPRRQIRAAPAAQPLGHPGRHGQSMGTAVGLEQCAFHDPALDMEPEPHPDVLSRSARLPDDFASHQARL